MKQSLLKLAFAAVMLMLVAPFAGSQAVAQTHNLTGTVVDAQGNPVAGAAVVIDGTTKGTSTGSDGSFALNGVMANQSLLVTFIGYEPQTVAIGSQTNMKVVLKEDNQTLDEVVVIGYGVQKKRDVTGSITSVKSDVFESRSVENAQQALQGKAPGVQVLSSGFESLDPYPRIQLEQFGRIGAPLCGGRPEGVGHFLPRPLVDRVDGDPQGRCLGGHLRCRGR